MRRVAVVVVASSLIAAISLSWPLHRQTFGAGQGTIRGSMHLGDRSLPHGWIEMIELTGPPEDRCGPGDCGLDAAALSAGAYWNPGTWRVIPPDVKGWERPAPFEVVVQPGKRTRIEADYVRG
jgi:hypothetical protein